MGITINISNSEKSSEEKLDKKISRIKNLLCGILFTGILFVFLIIILIIILNKKQKNYNENTDKIGNENTNKRLKDNKEGNEELKITIEDLF